VLRIARNLATGFVDLVDGRSSRMREIEARMDGFNRGHGIGYDRGFDEGWEAAEVVHFGNTVEGGIDQLQRFANGGAGE
jgi:hypothetical protein